MVEISAFAAHHPLKQKFDPENIVFFSDGGHLAVKMEMLNAITYSML